MITEGNNMTDYGYDITELSNKHRFVIFGYIRFLSSLLLFLAPSSSLTLYFPR